MTMLKQATSGRIDFGRIVYGGSASRGVSEAPGSVAGDEIVVR